MTNIIDRIARAKRQEVEALKTMVSAEKMMRMAYSAEREVISMKDSIKSRDVAVIAEHKRRSPSRGEMAPMSSVAAVAEEYASNGAAAMSVLTDTPFFGGSLTDLAVARATAPWLPMLRKEFIVDDYQVCQARVYGADAILLIAAMIDSDTLCRLNNLAHELGMQTLVELHSEGELASLPADADMVGVNNRDLTSFKTDISNCARLVDSLPADMVKIAESGIKTPEDLRRLKSIGFDGFLIGEALMSCKDSGGRLRDFIIINP
ncbi:MAG: indole-3-glycerol phosphate synthase TrpC [Muribaculaceae bacterium]|nr:indole-3-glycerol phosphate synthase TrpC [Muribaculaceae bacterium]